MSTVEGDQVRSAAERQCVVAGTAGKELTIRSPCNCVGTVATVVNAAATGVGERVVAAAALQNVGPTCTVQRVARGVAFQVVARRVSGAIDRTCARQGQVLLVCAERSA